MAKRHGRRETHVALYHRDETLFSQRMEYTFHGITWLETPCCYCGDPARTVDHVFPVAALTKLVAVGSVEIPQELLRTVPACKECNGLLSDKVFRSFEERRLYAKALLSQRYEKAVNIPYWSPEELAQLEGRLYIWIAAGQDAREMIFERLRF